MRRTRLASGTKGTSSRALRPLAVALTRPLAFSAAAKTTLHSARRAPTTSQHLTMPQRPCPARPTRATAICPVPHRVPLTSSPQRRQHTATMGRTILTRGRQRPRHSSRCAARGVGGVGGSRVSVEMHTLWTTGCIMEMGVTSVCNEDECVVAHKCVGEIKAANASPRLLSNSLSAFGLSCFPFPTEPQQVAALFHVPGLTQRASACE